MWVTLKSSRKMKKVHAFKKEYRKKENKKTVEKLAKENANNIIRAFVVVLHS